MFASERLDVNHMETARVPEFLAKYAGTSVLGAPLGDATRLRLFPPLAKRILTIRSGVNSVDEACADVLLSSLGWVSVTSLASLIKASGFWVVYSRIFHFISTKFRFPSCVFGK